MNFDYEVLIIGGGPAGISAGMTLGRLSRTALVCDDNKPRNGPSEHINNFPTRDGIHPEEWRKLARKDLEKYKTIKSFNGRVDAVHMLENGFRAKLSDGSVVAVKKVILTYGVKDKMPDLPGFKELWGKSIFHCPFCHGFEIKGSMIGFLISNEMAFHALPMILTLSSDIVLFTNSKVILTEEQRKFLAAKKVRLFEEKVSHFRYENTFLKAVHLESGKEIERDFLFYGAELPFELKSDIGQGLGAKKNQFGFYEVNEMGATSVPGVFAAGDNISMFQSVLLACASGTKAGIGVIAELLGEAH